MIEHLFKWIFNIQSPTIWYLTFYETSGYRDYYTITRKVRKKYDMGYQMLNGFEKGKRWINDNKNFSSSNSI